MNILPVSSYASAYNRYTLNKVNNNNITSPIKHDSVSFGHINKPAYNTGKDIVENQIKRKTEQYYKPMANIFLVITKAIAEKFEAFGVSFNEAYAAANPIKSAGAAAEKMSRYGTLSIPDQIRTTLFSKNFYDLSILFEKIIPEYEKEFNYILHDLEICMKDMDKKMNEIPEQYKKYNFEKQRNSGVEQIQFRLIRKEDLKNPNPVKHEVIIIPGYEYAKAKHYESKYIYSNTRKLGELNFIKKGSEKDNDVIKAKIFNSRIKEKLNNVFSENLFSNAKYNDMYDMGETSSLFMSVEESNLIQGYFSSIKKCMDNYYKAAKSRAKTQARLDELNKLQDEDKELLKYIQDNIVGNKDKKIEGTINFFNKGGHLIEDPFVKKSK